MLDFLNYAFFRNALMGILLLSVVAGVIGTYIVARRMVSITGGITHTCFGGLGLGYFLGINPLLMAGVFAIGASAGVEWMSARQKIREDTAIAVVWALGMALGVLFVFLTPGYVPELNTFLFGNILTVSRGDLIALNIYTLVTLGFFVLFYKKIVICAFDRDFATVAGLPVKFISYSMTILVAVGIVLSIRMVGIMLLMSMLSLPQIIAETRFHRFSSIMIGSIIVALVCSLSGLMLSTVINVPCSAMIVIVLVAVYVLVAGSTAISKAIKTRQKALDT